MIETMLAQTREKIRLGDPDTYENLCIFPILSGADEKPDYLSMKTALEKELVEVKEISEGGSVPNLKVINRSDLPILIIDGEELAGAKQNRIANTTILLASNTETQIPVSCTEQGRWRYNSDVFADSGHVMSSRARYSKSFRVKENLKRTMRYEAGQGEVWNDVADLHHRSGTHSRTQAMKDAFDLQKQKMEDYLKAFPLRKYQKGILVFMNGELAGMDFVSRETAYGDVHEKLLKSHVIEAITDNQPGGTTPAELQEKATAFLNQLLELPATERASVGLGKDYRCEGEKANAAVLTHEDQVIHWTAFPNAMVDNPGRGAQDELRYNSRQRGRFNR